MIAGQKSRGTNGKDNALFPLAYMYLTQGEYEYTYSHNGTYAMDFAGYGSSGVILNCPYYAPFDCHCVAIWGSSSPMVVWESDSEVNYVDGTTAYMCIGFVHDDNVSTFHVGDRRRQGDIIGHTGTYGVGTGDHVHIEVASGHYAGYYQNSSGIYQLRNEYHIYNALGVNDTVLVKDYYVNHQNVRVNYPWKYFGGEPTPPTPTVYKKSKFPWVLYANKLRKMSSLH